MVLDRLLDQARKRYLIPPGRVCRVPGCGEVLAPIPGVRYCCGRHAGHSGDHLDAVAEVSW